MKWRKDQIHLSKTSFNKVKSTWAWNSLIIMRINWKKFTNELCCSYSKAPKNVHQWLYLKIQWTPRKSKAKWSSCSLVKTVDSCILVAWFNVCQGSSNAHVAVRTSPSVPTARWACAVTASTCASVARDNTAPAALWLGLREQKCVCLVIVNQIYLLYRWVYYCFVVICFIIKRIVTILRDNLSKECSSF